MLEDLLWLLLLGAIIGIGGMIGEHRDRKRCEHGAHAEWREHWGED